MCPRNEETLELNEKILTELIKGDVYEYKSVDDIETDDEIGKTNFPLEYLNTLTPSGIPPHLLRLKIDCVIMFSSPKSPRQTIFSIECDEFFVKSEISLKDGESVEFLLGLNCLSKFSAKVSSLCIEPCDLNLAKKSIVC